MVERIKALFRSPYFYWVAALVSLTVVLSLAYWLGWLGAVAGSPWAWVIGVLLAAGGVFAALQWGAPWLQERRFLRAERSEYVAAGEASPEEFHAKFAKALQLLKSLPQLKGKAEPLYALPWYLLIGTAQSGKTAAVQAANLFSPLLSPSTDGTGTQNYDWWVSNSAVILDTAGRYTIPVDAARDRSEWYRLLRLLRHHRQAEPINGLLITVGADWLASQSEEALRADASQLRDRIEEAVRELGCDFPVYLLVTKCDAIEGFTEFFGQLPERMYDEVLGYVDDATAARGTSALQRLGAGLQSVYDRLHYFRLAILESPASEDVRQAIFSFPEEFKLFHQQLMIFAEPLLSDDVRYHTPLFRGIFFTSAQQTGARLSLLRRQLNLSDARPESPGSKRYFLSDLFDGILPRDRALVSTTPREQRRRGVRRLFAFGGSAVLVVLLTALVVRAFASDRRIAASVDDAACPDTVAAATGRAQLDAVERCRTAVQSVSDQNRGRSRWSTWLFNRSGRLEARLRDNYVRHFNAELLNPLNGNLDRAFAGSTDPLPLMLLVAQRVQLARRCATAGKCSEHSISGALPPDYALMLVPGRDRRAPPDDVTRLQQTYTAYLLWQGEPPQFLQQDLSDDQKRLRQWLSAQQFSLDSLLPLVNKRSPPITYDDYWQQPAPIITSAPPRIEAACTKKVWEQDVAPFLQQIQDAVPDAAPKLHAFQEQYQATCLTDWHRFLAGFAQGAERWKGPDRRRTLALRLLTPDSPLSHVMDDGAANLTPWVAGSTPAWADRFRQYAASEQRKAYQDALAKISARLERGDLTEAAFKLAQEAFAEGEPTEKSANPLLHAWWIASHAEPVAADPQKPGEGVLNPLLEDSLRFVWRVILDEAGSYLQNAWAENVMTPLKGLPPAEQVVMLYGPGGKVRSFAEQFLRPFLAGDEPHASNLIGAALPISPQFAQVLTNAKDLKPLLEDSGASQPVLVSAGGPSEIEARSSFRGEQTLFSVSCSGKAYRITNRPVQADESSTAVPWSNQGCSDLTINIYFFAGQADATQESPGAKRLQLTKTYAGHTGFLQFVQDFATGVHRFQLDDLAGDPDTLRSGVTAISVHYRVEIPPGMKKLVDTLQEAGPPAEIVSSSSS